MHPNLRINRADFVDPLKVPPEALLKQLESASANLEALTREFHCTSEDLEKTLDDPETGRILKIRTKLAAAQCHLLACKFAPLAISKIINLIQTSEKPEVARRCAVGILHTAGIATQTKSIEPDATPRPVPPEEDDQPQMGEYPGDEEEHAAIVYSHFLAKHLYRTHRICLQDLLSQKADDLITFVNSLASTLPKRTPIPPNSKSINSDERTIPLFRTSKPPAPHDRTDTPPPPKSA